MPASRAYVGSILSADALSSSCWLVSPGGVGGKKCLLAVFVRLPATRPHPFAFRDLGEHLSAMLPEQPRFIEPATVIG